MFALQTKLESYSFTNNHIHILKFKGIVANIRCLATTTLEFMREQIETRDTRVSGDIRKL